MVEHSQEFDTFHEDIIQEAKLDFYGKRLATCSADGTIKLFSTEDPSQPLRTLQSHTFAVLSIDWSHPIFGQLLASSGIDRKVLIYKETAHNEWEVTFEYTNHEAPVSSIQFSPWEVGLNLLAGSFDGYISLLSSTERDWTAQKILAHSPGVCSVSWSPVNSISTPYKQFVTGGADNVIKVWTCEENNFECEDLEKHTRVVRSVDWCPMMTTEREVIASCSEDGRAIVWVKNFDEDFWKSIEIIRLKVPIWKVSWNITGNALAISSGDNMTRVIKENAEGVWKVINQIGD